MSSPVARSEPSPLRKFVYVLLPSVLALLIVELLCRLVGWGAAPLDLSRGFDARAQYLVATSDGGHRTQMFDDDADNFTIPAARAEVFRVLLFGGSNTESFLATALQRELNRRLKDVAREVEVINLGRRGYGSERVALLFEQALAVKPDLAVLYTGHNEFVEWGFATSLEQRHGSWTAAGIQAASHLRSFRATVRGIEERFGEEAAELAPEGWKFEHERFQHLTFDATLERIERYRDNLDRVLRMADEAGVPIALCTVIGNRLSAPMSSTLPEGISPAEQQRLIADLEAARAHFPERFRPLVPAPGDPRPHKQDWIGAEIPDPRATQPPVMPRMLGALGRQDLGFPADGWTPWIHDFAQALAAFHAREVDPDESRDLQQCDAELQAVLARVSDHPEALFRLGLVRFLQGRDAEAAELLERAAAADRAPRKASELTNEVVRALAAEHPGTHLFDADALYRDRCHAGIVGFEVLYDFCHLHKALIPLFMADLARFLEPVIQGDSPP